MAKTAKIESLDVLRQFRAAMIKFAEASNAALGDAESEMQRVQMWVENEMSSYWQHQVRKRQEALSKAKEALRQKQIFKDPSGARQSYVEEEKAVALAHRRVQEAEQKIVNVKRWARQLEKEIHLYKGSVQRFATTVLADIPQAVAKLDRLAGNLEGYFAVAPTEAGSTAGANTPAGAAMSRPEAGPPQPGDIYRNLRQQTPNAAAREAAPAGDPTRAAWAAGELPAINREAVEKLTLPRDLIDPNSVVTYAADIWEAKRIYLQRTTDAFPRDSGWYIGPADGSQPLAFESAKVEQLLQARPGFAGLLPLPPGTLIVIDAAGIATILDAQDREVWGGTGK